MKSHARVDQSDFIPLMWHVCLYPSVNLCEYDLFVAFVDTPVMTCTLCHVLRRPSTRALMVAGEGLCDGDVAGSDGRD